MGIAERKAREYERREQDILKAAYTLFKTKGPEGVTSEMIAEESEIGKGTIYKHFKSKKDIFAVLLTQHVEKLHTYVKARGDVNLPVLDGIRQFLQLHLDFFHENPDSYKVCCEFRRFIVVDTLDPVVITRFENMFRKKNEPLEEMLKKASDEGLLIDLPVSDIATLVSGMFLGIMGEISDGFVSKREMINEAIINGFVKSIVK
jgi:AcrR family transcriptional regulator